MTSYSFNELKSKIPNPQSSSSETQSSHKQSYNPASKKQPISPFFSCYKLEYAECPAYNSLLNGQVFPPSLLIRTVMFTRDVLIAELEKVIHFFLPWFLAHETNAYPSQNKQM